MRVSLIAPDLATETVRRHVIAQARLFRRRGDEVHLSLSAPPSTLPDDLADLEIAAEELLPPVALYIYHYSGDYALLAGLRQRDEGTVLVHDHGGAPQEWLPAHFADLCLVDDSERRDELVDECGLSPERVFVMPRPDQEAAYEAALTALVDRALTADASRVRRLPWEAIRVEGRPSLPRSEERAVPPEGSVDLVGGQTALKGNLNLAQSQADVMLHDYEVRSQIPLLGPLIAWTRRNLTSHLREPYVDPTLERQVAFNQTVVAWMEQIQARLEALEAQVQLSQGRTSAVADDEAQEAERQQTGSNRQVSDAG